MMRVVVATSILVLCATPCETFSAPAAFAPLMSPRSMMSGSMLRGSLQGCGTTRGCPGGVLGAKMREGDEDGGDCTTVQMERRGMLRLLAAGTAGALLGSTRAAQAKDADFGSPMMVMPLEGQEKRIPPPQNPYEQMEPFGESFRGKKGPNLQLPEELSQDDAVPAAMSALDAKREQAQSKKVDYFENFSGTGIVGSMLWGAALYYGIWFDINIETNAIQIASGEEGDVRPSDWLKLRLGGLMGMDQETWSDSWQAPVSIQAFTLGAFATMGTVTQRVIEVGLGDSFAFMGGITAAIWAGVYELGRTQQKGYRLTREEQDEMDELTRDFKDFVEARIVLKPTARMHIREFTSAFRGQFGKYRTAEMISDIKVEGIFKSYARRVTGMRGKAGFYKGIGIKAQSSAFGGSSGTLRREKEAQSMRSSAKDEAEAAAAKSMQLAEREKGDKGPDNKMRAGEAAGVGDGDDEW